MEALLKFLSCINKVWDCLRTIWKQCIWNIKVFLNITSDKRLCCYWHFLSCIGYTALNKNIMTDEMEGTWKDVIMVYFKVLSQNFAGKNLNRQFPGKDLHPGSSKYESVEGWPLTLHSGKKERAGQRNVHSTRRSTTKALPRFYMNVWNLVKFGL